ncbi:hypothetical protein BDV95DRAFT_596732 [Massariosphaeria phaeospora]|uniref:Ankyrin repeat-containing domain protein n=1 Tax=Massariosphaeria phaeospora TaxID=100035 RepID=A0A7C8M8T8_9PLEO|nr:hypothetical protein BDV95DRAFT_596732 [Massariosphaeria phaeospora]
MASKRLPIRYPDWHEAVGIAASNGHVSIVVLILGPKFDMAIFEGSVYAAMKKAACAGQWKTVRVLLEEYPDHERRVLCSLAAEQGLGEILKNTIDWSIQHDLKCDYDCALVGAVAKGHLRVCQLLLECVTTRDLKAMSRIGRSSSEQRGTTAWIRSNSFSIEASRTPAMIWVMLYS